MFNQHNSPAYRTVVSNVVNKLTCLDLAVDAVKLNEIAVDSLNDRRWVTQHPIRLLISSNFIGTRYNRCRAPIWFEDYLNLFRRVVKARLLAIPGITKVRFAHSKGRYLDISLDTEFLAPYITGMLSGHYPANAAPVLSSIVTSRHRRGGLGVLFKGIGCSYTFRINYTRYLNSLDSRHACSISKYIEEIITSISSHVTLLNKPHFNYFDVFQKYTTRMGEN